MLDRVRHIVKTTESLPFLKQRWEAFREENPKARIREAALKLGVTELELVAVRCGETNIRLRPEWPSLIAELESLGPVLTITRNDAVVHETHGVFRQMRQHGSVGMFFAPGIDTRFFLDRWGSVFAVNENQRLSLQFFDRFGVAAHKVYVTDKTRKVAYEKIVSKYRSENQSLSEPVNVAATRLSQDKALDSDDLKLAWSKIRNVHEGSRIVRANGGDFQAVYQVLGDEFARPLGSWSVELLLKYLADEKLSTMIFVMNKSAVQAYAGPVTRLMRMGPWFNVLDPDFNLHLKTSDIGRVWYVRKPSDDGWVTTLHVFDRHGREIMLIADNRVKGQAESEEWRNVMKSLAESNPVN